MNIKTVKLGLLLKKSYLIILGRFLEENNWILIRSHKISPLFREMSSRTIFL